jgi:predicted nicotinamide N-methyase
MWFSYCHTYDVGLAGYCRWTASIILLNHLSKPEHSAALRGKRVLELGSGRVVVVAQGLVMPISSWNASNLHTNSTLQQLLHLGLILHSSCPGYIE